MHGRTLLFPLVAVALLLTGSLACADRPGGGDGSGAGRQKPKRAPDDLRRIRALEAELGVLKRKLAGEQNQPFRVINAHEHLKEVSDLDKYLPAARQHGIVKTVVVASPDFTIWGKGEKGEPGMTQNFEKLLEAAKKYPDEIVPFFTLDPADPDKLARAKRHHAAGGKGVKLYAGHSNFYQRPLDDPDMQPVFAWLEEEGIPINFHINLEKFIDEFERVMQRHPKLNVMVPHYGVLFWKGDAGKVEKLKQMLRTYPRFYLDTSLGTREILISGMQAMQDDRELWTQLIAEFPDRFVYGTDSVITGNREKTTIWYGKVIEATRDQLEKESFTTELAAAYSKYGKKDMDPDGTFEGFALSPEILKKIYEENAERWLSGGKAP